MPIPTTHYTQNRGKNIAYQIIGDGPIDIVFNEGIISHLEVGWEHPGYASALERLASFARIIKYDRIGYGLSERATELAPLEDRLSDIKAVMDAAGSEKAVMIGWSQGGPISILFSATYPENVSHLILLASNARSSWAPDYPFSPKPYDPVMRLQEMFESWGKPWLLGLISPSVANNPIEQNWWAKYVRYGASPTMINQFFAIADQIDIRELLSAVHVPTLVIHRKDDKSINVENGRYLAKHIPDAKYVELSGSDHSWWTESPEIWIDEVEHFLTGEIQSIVSKRILSSVLFTDIVDSTRMASKLGDSQWRKVLESHNELAQQEVKRFRGKYIKSTGDGILARFDGPARAVHCAHAIRQAVPQIGIQIRAGIHIGEIELIKEDIGGIAVHIAARVLGKAGDDEVWVSRTIKDLVAGSGIQFIDKGEYELKGVSGSWHLYKADES